MTQDKPNGLLPLPLLILCVLLALAGAVAFVIGLASAPERAWAELLVSGFYAVALTLAAGMFLTICALTGAEWNRPFLKVPLAVAGAFPVVALPFAGILAGLHHLYHWAHHGAAAHDAVLAAKAPWLNPTGFTVRFVLYLALWAWAGRRLIVRRASTPTAVVFALIFAPTFSLASVDWLMSVEPHWSSTLYPWYVFVTSFAGGLALLALVSLQAHARGLLPDLTVDHRHDLGKLVFTFSFFWGYLWFCQYMLIWYANIPEEVTHYIARAQAPWYLLFAVNPVVNLVVPFLALISVHAKKSPAALAAASALVVAGHWLDVHMLVMPAVVPAGPALTALDLLVASGVASVLALAVHRNT